MKNLLQFSILALLFSFASFGANAEDQPQVASGHEKVVLQVSDSDVARWNLTLNNAFNLQDLVGKDNIDIEIVAYGPGIDMLRLESLVGDKIDKAIGQGIKIVACQNTMKMKKLTKEDMLPSIGYVPSGVAEIIRKEKAGWSYVRP
jgi:intracellular sulfur oxidation DsrE/DsrF family protein